jgi:hypothetical protein
MATSFTRTREQMRDMVLRRLGVSEEGQTPSAEDAGIVNDAMDLRLKELHELGVLWWQVSGATADVALTGGTATATISQADFLFPVSMMLRVGIEDQAVEIIGHRQYQDISDKASQGEPAMVFINGSTCWFYPVPSIAYTAKLTYEAAATDTAFGVAPDIPVSMMRAFALLVAGDLVDDFSLPEQKAQRLIAQQPGAMRTIRALNAEHVDSTTVAPVWF